MTTLRIISGLLLYAGTSWSQQYIISTIAGGAPLPTPVAGLTASITPQGLATDSTGNVFFTTFENNCVFKVDRSGVLTRIAGNSRAGYSGDGGPATSAQLTSPQGVTVDGAGNIFIADTGNGRVRRVAPNGIITTVAGGGFYSGATGDGGPATTAQISFPQGVAVDGAGNLFIADAGSENIRKVAVSGVITTVAGNGTAGFSGDGGSATSAQLNAPTGVTVDASGNIFIADWYNYRIRKVSPAGIISTVAGNGTTGFSGDGGAATSAQLSNSVSLTVDGSGNLFFSDQGNGRIRKVDSNGIITTVAGKGAGSTPSGDGGPATSATLCFFGILPGVAVDTFGNLFIANQATVREVAPSGIITTIAGNSESSFSGDGGPATAAQFSSPASVAVDGSGNLFIADFYNARIRKVSANGTITTVAGNGTPGFSGDGGPATGAMLSAPLSVAVDNSGNLFIADSGNARIRKVSTNGIITTVAGNGSFGYSGDGGPATKAQLAGSSPFPGGGGIAVDGSGNIFITDSFDFFTVRKISAGGIITTVAGNGTSGFSGDGGPATSAQLNRPEAVAADGAGDLFIADTLNSRIRKVSPDGTISTVAGDCDSSGATVCFPTGVAVDGAGNLFIASPGSVQKLSPTGIITAIAGNGGSGYSGDGGPATSAEFSGGSNEDLSLAVGNTGNVYLGDAPANAVRLLTPTSQTVLIGAVVDAASESAAPVSPGQIVAIYGSGLGPSQLVVASPTDGSFGTQLAGTTVSFNGIPAPLIYTSATQISAIVPYSISGNATNVTVSYQGAVSSAFPVPVAASSPGFFTSNSTGAGQAAALNAVDNTLNSAANPVQVGAYISLFVTGEGQTMPSGVDGQMATVPLPSPVLPVTATIGGLPAVVQYKGAVYGAVAGLMQLNLQIPAGVTPGGYVPVVLEIGSASTVNGAVWIAVAN